MVIHNELHAYRKHKSSWTAIASLTSEIIQRWRCYVTFLDMSKAFDCVSCQAFEKVLNKWDLPSNKAKMIIAQYTDSNVYIELNGAVAKPFLHTNGICQGCTLSGIFWNLVMTDVHNRLDTIFPGNKHRILSYANDIIIITSTTLEAHVIKKAIRDELQAVGLTLNDDKEILKEFDINGNDMSPIDWLGVTIVGNLTWDAETERRIKVATTASETIKQIRRKQSILLGP